jgi:outer membrane protein OmpA-like peptidoglycan-associated protein
VSRIPGWRLTTVACVAFALLVADFCSPAGAQQTAKLCLQEATRKHGDGQGLGIAVPEAEQLIMRIAREAGLSGSAIKVVACDYEPNAFAYYQPPGDTSIPAGEYIIYSPRWVHQVIGTDAVQAMALFGHELGHLLNRDFTTRLDTPNETKEREADRFAGCAVARLNGSWDRLKDLLSRLREEKGDPRYPGRLASLAAAEEGYRLCGRPAPTSTPISPSDEANAFDRAQAAYTLPAFRAYLEAAPSGFDSNVAVEAIIGLVEAERLRVGNKTTNPSPLDIKFEYRVAVISRASIGDLLSAAKLIKTMDCYVFVRGFSEDIGEPPSQRRLALMRANAVKNLLIQHGVAENAIIAVGIAIRPRRAGGYDGASIDIVPR